MLIWLACRISFGMDAICGEVMGWGWDAQVTDKGLGEAALAAALACMKY